MVCQDHQHGLPKLDPEADVSAVQLVGPQTSRKEIESLYCEVYKLWRVLGVSSQGARTHSRCGVLIGRLPGWERSKLPQMMRKPKMTNIRPPRSRTPRRARRDTSVERSLTEVRETHQKALAMAATLEEEIESLSWPLIRSYLKHEPILEAVTVIDADLGEERGGTASGGRRTAVLPTLSTITLRGGQSLGKRQWPPRILICKNHWNWGQRSPASSRGQLRVWERRT